MPVFGIALWKRGDWTWLHGVAVATGVAAVLTGATVREFSVLDLVVVAGAWFVVRERRKREGL
ncbi:MAG: hypothetical protein OXO54_00055 [Chloroflexota bacterium]|nr:hypothetical protein [Chloroflexota bacterium]